MRTVLRFALAALALLLPVPALAQAGARSGSGSAGAIANYGYSYSPWQPTAWSSVEIRTRCDGEPVRGMNTGPIRWVVEYRNRSQAPVSFDYAVLPPGENKPPALSGRGTVKPGKTLEKLATLPTTRCDDGVLTKIGKVRFGADADSVPYARPDRRS